MATYAYSDEEGVIIHDYPIALLWLKPFYWTSCNFCPPLEIQQSSTKSWSEVFSSSDTSFLTCIHDLLDLSILFLNYLHLFYFYFACMICIYVVPQVFWFSDTLYTHGSSYLDSNTYLSMFNVWQTKIEHYITLQMSIVILQYRKIHCRWKFYTNIRFCKQEKIKYTKITNS
jgi:hypothetical protein